MIATERYGHAAIINMKEDLTEDTLKAFEQTVDHVLEDSEVVDIVLNLENVNMLDSVGMEYLLDLQDRLAGKLGQVKLLNVSENVQKILEITRLSSTFEQYRDIPEAVRAIHA